MAPEQAMAQDIGPWTDLYSVGCMAFELFTGNVPFHDSDAPMAILLRHVNEPIAPVKSIVPDVDQRVSDWIEHMLVKEPSQRTQSAQDAWDEFEEILLSLHGPRWRREARLVERVTAEDGAKPLTPAPFQGTTTGPPGSEEFKSFAWGEPGGDTGASSTAPPMYTPPPSASAPALPEPVVGPPTPLPSSAVPVPVEPVEEPGFVTFGAPAPAPPTDALIPPPPAEAAPAAEAAVVTPPPAEQVAPPPPAPVEPAAVTPPPFETYMAPGASRPPAGGGLTPPRVEAAAPPVEPVAPPVERVTPPPAAAAPPPVADLAETVMPRALRDTPPAAPPPSAAAPPAEHAPRRWGLIAGIGAGVLVVIVLVAVLAGGGGGSKPPAPTATPAKTAKPPAKPVAVKANAVSFEVPGGWTQASSAPDVPGFSGSPTAMSGPGGATVVAGLADKSAANPTLLSSRVLKANGGTPSGRQTVNGAGGVQAYKYPGVNIGGGKQATFYVVPDVVRRGDAGLLGAGRHLRLDRLDGEDHRGPGVPARAEQGVHDALRKGAFDAVRQGEPGGLVAQPREHPRRPGVGHRAARQRLRGGRPVAGEAEAEPG